MFQGKMKAVTFSYDDGVTQDRRLIALFNKYGLRGTFNLNSGLLGQAGSLIRENVTVSWVKPQPSELRRIYEGHEVAAHTLTHPLLTKLSDDEIIREVEDDRLKLCELMGYEVVGMAYPGGGINYDERVVSLIRENTGIRYARTTVENGRYDIQDDLFCFQPTVYHHHSIDEMISMGEQFVHMTPDKPQLFYVWGHSYEFDIFNDWDKMEQFCKLISGHKDIYYGTNHEVLLNE